MEKLLLQKREVFGKKNKNLRRNGLVPAVVYNSKRESLNTQLSASDASWLYRNTTSTTILDTELENKNFKSLVKEFDINPMTNEIVHVSLFEVDEKAPMVFTIPFDIVGVSPAVKNNLGILVNVLDAIEVKCGIADLVPSIEINISGLDHPGQTITVDDIKLPEGMTLVNDDLRGAAIVTITEAQKVEDVATATTEEGAENGTEEGGEDSE